MNPPSPGSHGSNERCSSGAIVRAPRKGKNMYEESLAVTGMGAIVIGAAVVDAWWIAVTAISLGAALLVVERVVRARRRRNREL